MSVATYKQALSLVLAHEGGFANHPLDPGGATMRGVTQRTYDAFRRLRGFPLQSVRYISDEEVERVYRDNYWKLVRGDELPAGLDYALFDFAVNSGVSRAIKFLQAGLAVGIDGVIGDETLGMAIAKAVLNEELIINNLCADRMRFVRGLKTFATFGKGWTRRIMGNIDGAQPDKDKGVIDYGIAFARHDPVFTMPTAIGLLSGEYVAKAIPTATLGETATETAVSYDKAMSSGWGL